MKTGQTLKMPDILRFAKDFYRRLGATHTISEEGVSTKQTSEVDWHTLKAALEAEKERERRKWELWGIYGRR